MLHLSIEPEILELAKASGLNLSNEFEQWIRIRMNKSFKEDNKAIDLDIERAKALQRIKDIDAMAQARQNESNKEQLEIQALDEYIDYLKEKDKSINDGSKHEKHITNEEDERLNLHGIVFLYKHKFNQNITMEQAKLILDKRLKERGL